ncbi:sensor domain-containing diguanylate cyclase [Paenibacillus lemnae]|uniref:Diguanylate cyclase n=1 Tax=Paenibacillus lemnae TaxID=1330551 RepID=A0A848M3X4_PAELE|nr:diguanylate cyclase [Paenibacillus lemnae]NMO94941.1 diguanylate cyclase [Paenibacillus lemnae]
MASELSSSPKAADGIFYILEDPVHPVDLDGDWTFYWEQLIDPSGDRQEQPGRSLKVPGLWNEGESTRHGYGSYRLQVMLGEKHENLGLYIKNVSNSYKIWINGKLLGENGRIADNKAEAKPSRRDRLFLIPEPSKTLDIVIHVANYDHPRGGLTESIRLGYAAALQAEMVRSSSLDMFVIGALFIIGLYHLGLFSARSKKLSPFYFSIFCISISLRNLVTGKTSLYVLLPDFPWDTAVRIEYTTMAIAVISFSMFVRSLYPEELSRWILRPVLALSVLYGLLCVAAPGWLYMKLLPVYQLVIVFVTISCVIAFALAAWRKKEGAALALAAAIFLAATVLNDVLYNRHLLMTGYYIPLGLLVYVLANSFVLGLSFSRAYASTENLTFKLQALNNTLEEKVAERTAKLEEANQELQKQSLLDGLTGIANRRAFEADAQEMLEEKERDAPLYLYLIDIDHFKKFNDYYGHLAGDDCLRRVAEIIDRTASAAGGSVYRYGGEEFCLLYRGDRESAEHLAERIIKEVRAIRIPHEAPGASGFITVSFGFAAMKTGDSDKIDELIEAADLALYQAKQAGRDRYCVSI